jgi:hypothetical protein
VSCKGGIRSFLISPRRRSFCFNTSLTGHASGLCPYGVICSNTRLNIDAFQTLPTFIRGPFAPHSSDPRPWLQRSAPIIWS